MNRKRRHSREEALWNYRSHSLDNFCPPLEKYIENGQFILDAGCGPGTVTANVSEVLGAGSIVGIDREEKSLEEAKNLIETLGLSNAEFRAGDIYEIPFNDHTFDIVYSSAVFEYLMEPVRALTEMKRVTKPNGLCIVRAGDFGTFTLYPDCPALMKIFYARTMNNQQTEDSYFDGLVGRKLYDIYVQAALSDINIEAFVPPLSCNYPGSEHFEWRRDNTRRWFDPERMKDSGVYRSGVIDDSTIDQAKIELDAWLNHRGAYFMMTSVMAAGKA